MENLCPANMLAVRLHSVFPGQVEKTWYDPPDRNLESAKITEVTDLALNIMRQKSTIKTSWTVFKEMFSTKIPAKNTVGYMPIIQVLVQYQLILDRST